MIFDWGGVVTSPILDTVSAWLETERIDRDSYAAAMRPWVQRAYGSDDAESPIHALERGEVSDEEFEATLAARLASVDGGPVAAAGLLQRMFAANSWGTTDAYPRHLFGELFDDVVISGEVGMRKPEERIFLLATGRLGLTPQECAFVDDVEHNVLAARALGFVAVHHKDPGQTRTELSALLCGVGAR